MPQRFSRARIKMMREEDKDKWFIGFDYIIFFFIVSFGAIFTLIINPDDYGQLVMTAMFQILFALIGFIMFFFATMYPQSDARSGFPTTDDTSKMTLYFMVLFPTVMIITVLVTVVFSGIPLSVITGSVTLLLSDVPLSTTSANMQIVLTSAVVEETLFAAGAGVLLFKIFYYVFSAIFGPGQGTRLMAEITSSVVIAGFFAILHVGVYGFATVIMAILFTNRLVYQMAYYRTRNIMLSTLMHLLNNYMALAFSIMMLGG